jgi:hypothetical protein
VALRRQRQMCIRDRLYSQPVDDERSGEQEESTNSPTTDTPKNLYINRFIFYFAFY